MNRISTVDGTSSILFDNTLNPKSRYGQNFLVNPLIVDKILDQKEINKDSLVIEIGPGLGALTQILCEKAKKVLAFEIDSELSSLLKKNLSEFNNLEVYNIDFLKFNLESINYEGYSNIVFVSNLPYYITSQILIKLFLFKKECIIIAMMQKEVAMRIKNASDKDINDLVILSRMFSKFSIVTEVSKNDFFPKPNVNSTVLKFELLNIKDKEEIYKIINILYSQRRKTLFNILKNLLGKYKIKDEFIINMFNKCQISKEERIDQLSFNQIINLINILKESIFYKSYAKINYGLRVNDKIDNLHLLTTSLYLIDLYDSLEIYQLENKEIIIDSSIKIDNNVLYDVYKLVNPSYGIYIKLTKNIPIGSGLGGESSNIHCLLNYFINNNQITLDKAKEIAKKLSSDSLFFFEGHSCYLNNSIYEYKKIENIDLDKIDIILNDTNISTKEMFSKIQGNSKLYNNDFLDILMEDKSFNKFYNEVKKLYKEVFLSGSGSGLIGVDRIYNDNNLYSKYKIINSRIIK